MRTRLVKSNETTHESYISCVGAYQPWQLKHSELIAQLQTVARANQVGIAVILLHPHPAVFLPNNTEQRAKYPPVDEKVAELIAAGADRVVVCEFDDIDLNMNAYEFLNEARKLVRIHSLFMGGRQSLGTGPLGGSESLRDYCRKSGLGLFFIKTELNKEMENPNYVHSNAI